MTGTQIPISIRCGCKMQPGSFCSGIPGRILYIILCSELINSQPVCGGRETSDGLREYWKNVGIRSQYVVPLIGWGQECSTKTALSVVWFSCRAWSTHNPNEIDLLRFVVIGLGSTLADEFKVKWLVTSGPLQIVITKRFSAPVNCFLGDRQHLARRTRSWKGSMYRLGLVGPLEWLWCVWI